MKSPHLASLALCAALAATAGAAAAETPAAAAAPERACFHAKDAINFVAVDDRTVNVRVGVRQVYQLKLFSACVGVGWTERIALASRPGAFICTNAPAAVDLYIHTTTGRRRCTVTSLRKLTDEEIAALPKKERP